MSRPTPRLRAQLITDAVIASYIHDISVRHQPRLRAKQRPTLRYWRPDRMRIGRGEDAPAAPPRLGWAAA